MMGTWRRRQSRAVFSVIIFALVVMTAGCADLGSPGGGANETTVGQVTEPAETTAEPTAEPTPEPTDEPTPEPTDEPTETDTTAAGGGDGSGGDGEPGGISTTFLLGLLAVLVVGVVAVSMLRGRNKSAPSAETTTAAAASATETPSDSEQVISLLHKNNGRMFDDVLEEELGWSPAHTRRVLDGLVATGDVELKETETGTLVSFTSPS